MRGAAQADHLDHPQFLVPDLDGFPNDERLIRYQGERTKKILERVLGPQGKGQSTDSQAGQHGGDVPGEHRHQVKHRQHEQADLEGQRGNGPEHLGDFRTLPLGSQVNFHQLAHQVENPKDRPHPHDPNQRIQYRENEDQQREIWFER